MLLPTRRTVRTSTFRMPIGGLRWDRLLLVYAIVVTTIPLAPRFPASDLDSSWAAALNRAVVQGEVFGRDIVFTYGPYAAVFTRFYDPGLGWLPLMGGLLLAGGSVLLSFRLTRRAPRWMTVVLAALLISGLVPPEAIGVLFPLLVVLAAAQPDCAVVWRSSRWRSVAEMGLVSGALALLPLVKFSAVPSVAMAVLLSGWLLLRRRLLIASFVLVLGTAAWVMALWSVAGQPLTALPDYASTSMELVAGYSEAMAFRPAISVAVPFALSAAIVAVAPLISSRRAREQRIVLFLMAGATLFVTVKAGFVREDPPHVAVAFGVLAVVTLIVGAEVPLRRLRRLLVVDAVLMGLATLMISPWFGLAGIASNTWDSVARAPAYTVLRVVDDERLRNDYESGLTAVARELPLPRPGRDVDIYSWGQAALFAQHGGWNPRPVIQSYAAYTPDLARLNAEHLVGAGAPRQVLFQVASIDGRLPSLEDGASWPALLTRYCPARYEPESGYLELRRTGAQAGTSGGPEVVLEGGLGKRLEIPASETGWMAELDLAMTPLGRLRTMIWSPSPVQIKVTLASGEVEAFRFIPSMAREGFLLSPLVTDTQGFLGLATNNARGTEPQAVRAMEIDAVSAGSWQSAYRVVLHGLPSTGPLDSSGCS